MTDWQQRVVDEKAALDEKLKKIVIFLEGPNRNIVAPMDVRLLEQQYTHMLAYSLILGVRIARFK